MTGSPNSLIVYSLATCILLAVWARSQVWSRNLPRRWKLPAFAGRSALGFLSLFTGSQLLQQAVVFSTHWRLWPLLLAGAILIEGVMALSRLERNSVSRRAGRALTLLRGGVILAVILMLCQPVFVFSFVRQFQRHVVVLLDISASMQVPDNNLTAAERVRLSDGLCIPAALRPCRLDRLANQLNEASLDLRAQADWLNSLAEATPELRSRQLKHHAASRKKELSQVYDSLHAVLKALDETAAAPFLKDAARQLATLKEFKASLVANATADLNVAIKQTDDWDSASKSPDAYAAVRETLRKTSSFLTEAGTRLRPIGDSVDEAFYRSLPESARNTIDQTATLRRSELALGLLTSRTSPPPGTDKPSHAPSILEQLNNTYGVQCYTFGATPAEIRIKTLIDSTGTVTTLPSTPLQRQRTDIAGALAKVSSAMIPEQTAGVILLSDGRHNTGESVDSIARRFGVQQVPVFPVILGGNVHPPTDASILSVSAPESASTNDRVSFTVDLKIDGLAGTNVTVTLFDNTTPVASTTVTPMDGTAFRKQVLLSDAPKTNGMHAYRVQLQTFPSEVDTNNNCFNTPVLIDSDSINVLLIENSPRWEFRYLKNLFVQQGRNVRLQYLLFNPDRIDGITNRPPRPASVSDDPTETEATLLPANEAEWMKFDVIILGDVAPAQLGRPNMEILQKYVLHRGGSLIVISGSRSMPQAFNRTPLADILPVTFKPAIRPLLAAPEPEFRLSLTAEGRNTLFMRLNDDPAENLDVWSQVPGLHWRNSSITAKSGATVLAYATTPEGEVEGMPPRIPDADTLLKQRQIEQENALVVTHQAGFGSVLMFGFDQTWRLRYRKGDLLHHKLWGQVLRWATADRIATGSSTVRIGTSRSRYPAGVPIRITARLATPNFLPITKAAPSATVWSGNRKLSRHRLTYRDGSPGIYVAEIASLPVGQYRLELDATGISELESNTPRTASTEFAVTSGIDSETTELTADRGVLAGVAGLTAGTLLEPTALNSLVKRLGQPRITRTERRQLDLWSSWPWFLLILSLLTAEWIIRKKVRLP